MIVSARIEPASTCDFAVDDDLAHEVDAAGLQFGHRGPVPLNGMWMMLVPIR